MSATHPDREELALAALPAESPDPEVVAHLAECASCRAEVAELARTVTLAKDGIADVNGHAAPERVWAAIAAELGPDLAPSDAASDAVPPRRAERRVRRPTRRVALVAAAALIALVIGVVVGVGLGGRNDPAGRPPAPTTVVAQLRPVGAIDPTGSGTLSTVEHAGIRTMTVQLSGVPDAAGADYLEAWLMNRDGTQIVALGALTRDGSGYLGSFTVPANLPMGELDVVDISAERYDGNPGHSGVSILRGTLS
ncbi:MAG: anti-sigma factor [Pseudonocardia sp.]|nr:anti-sigma factor [Pseudonocardia sp.]